MKTVETIKNGKNFTAVNVGKLSDIKDYVLPFGEIEIPGKVFVGQALQATGSEEGCAEQMTAPHIILTFYCRENASIDDKGAFFETVAACHLQILFWACVSRCMEGGDGLEKCTFVVYRGIFTTLKG